MTTTYANPQPLFEVLIAGLGVASQGLGVKCKSALRAVGSRAAPYLRAAAAGASPRRRKQIEVLAAAISETQDNSPEAAGFITDALLLAAAAKTKQPIGALIPALRQLGPNMIDALASEACSNRKKPDVCLRLLAVIEQLGGLTTVNAFRAIQTLMTSGDFAVRMFAAELLLGCPLARTGEGAGWTRADAMQLAFALEDGNDGSN